MLPVAMSNPTPSHSVAVIGGAVAGAEVAATLAERGVEVAVIEQNPRPYGKIEDGLPRWHVALRRKEYETIGEKLSRPNVAFVPLTSIGQRRRASASSPHDWGFSAVVLACGAWRDRPLPVEGAERFVGRGLIYQNPFVIWFNHANEAGYRGQVFEPQDGAIVVGGGLASIDVVKVLMLETTRAKLRERGIEVPMVELEVKGIPKILARHGLAFEALGLARLHALLPPARGGHAARRDARTARRPSARPRCSRAAPKLLEKAMEKYRFKVEPLCMPDGADRRGRPPRGPALPAHAHRRAARSCPATRPSRRAGPTSISSIGSIPEPIEGIETKGELFRFTDWELGRLDGYPNVFSAGNVVTGKGNIVASRKHAAVVASKVADEIAKLPPTDAAKLASVRERVRARQRAVGYTGDYASWMARVTPPDLE